MAALRFECESKSMNVSLTRLVETGIRQAASMTLRRTRTRLRIEGPFSRGEDVPQLNAIRNGLRQFCTTQKIERILLVLRTSPTGSADTESSGINTQRTLLERLVPHHLPRQEIVGEGISAYRTDWHSAIDKKIRSDDISPARRALVISTSMDRMFRRVDGYEVLRRCHERGHVFLSLLWEMSTAPNTSPYSWMTGAINVGTPQLNPATVAAFNMAVSTQQRAVTGQYRRNAIFAPISFYGHHEAVISQMIDDHLQMAELAGKCTNGRLVSYGNPEIPAELKHLNQPSAWPAARRDIHNYIVAHTRWETNEIRVEVELFQCPCHTAFKRRPDWTHNLACRCFCDFCKTYSCCPCPRGSPCQCPLICDCTCAHCHVGQLATVVRGEVKFDPETYLLPAEKPAAGYETKSDIREQARKVANPQPRSCRECGTPNIPRLKGRIIGLCWPCYRRDIDERKADPTQHRVCRAKAVNPDLCSGPGFTVKNDFGYYCIPHGPDRCKDKLRAWQAQNASVTVEDDSESDAEMA